MIADTEDTCLRHNELVILCCFTSSPKKTTLHYILFPHEVDTVPDFSACNSDNERKTLKAPKKGEQTSSP